MILGGNIDASGKWTLAPLNVGAPALSENMFVDDNEMALKDDVKVGPHQINLIGQQETDPATTAQVLDQRVTNDHNVACASCHVADARVFPVIFDSDDQKGKASFLKSMSTLLNGRPRVSELLIENEIHVGKMGFEAPAVRIFGYLDNRPLLSERVVSDSAIAVEQANSLLSLKPTPQCQTPAERLTLLTCLYLDKSDATLNACLKSSCTK